MVRQEKDDDKTRVQPPVRAAKNKIPARYRASVVIVEGHAEGMEYPIEKITTVLGRDKNADIAIKDSLISRQHAAIVYHNNRFILKDLGSTNGTYVKSKPVEKVHIRHRDKFRIGETLIQFILEETSGVQVYEVQEEDD